LAAKKKKKKKKKKRNCTQRPFAFYPLKRGRVVVATLCRNACCNS